MADTKPAGASRDGHDEARPSTLKKVAQEAGVSVSTVSRVLNGAKWTNVSLTPETKEKVRRAAERLGYRPDPNAQALRLRLSGRKQIGVIIRGVRDPFFWHLLDPLIQQCSDFDVLIGSAQGRDVEADQLQTLLETRRCDALVIVGDVLGEGAHREPVVRIPVIWLCQGDEAIEGLVVNTDNALGVRKALEYLHDELGHRKIAYVAQGFWGDVRERTDAYESFMRRRGLLRQDYVQELPFGISRPVDLRRGAVEVLKTLLSLPDRPTAVLASTDAIAIGLLKATTLLDQPIRVPEQLSLMGFDGLDSTELTIPSMTTVSQPLEEMARRVVTLLQQTLNGTEISPQRIQLPPRLEVRDSCAPLHAEK